MIKKVVVVTNLLPHYQIDFFNQLVKVGNIDLTVFSDISSKSVLNNYEPNKCNFSVINSPVKEVFGLCFRPSIKKSIKKIAPDHLIFYGNPREFSLSTLMFYFWLTGEEFYVHGMFHRIGGETILSKLYYWVVGKIASKCFTYGKKGAEVLLNLGVQNKKIKIIGTAINEEIPISYSNSMDENELLAFKRKNGICDKKVVLQVVRLSKIKKPDILLYVAEKIEQLRGDVVFVMIGGGEMYTEIKEKISKLGLGNSVLLLGPVYNEKELSYWFKSAKVFVMPTCIGLSAHHAFSYSLPIITDDDLMNQASEFELLSNGLNSLLYQSGNIDSFKGKLLDILNDDELQYLLSKNALHTVKNIYSLNIKCSKYLNSL